jgi:hypothetical protein
MAGAGISARCLTSTYLGRLGIEPSLGAIGIEAPHLTGLLLRPIKQSVFRCACAGPCRLCIRTEAPKCAFDFVFEPLRYLAPGVFAIPSDGLHHRPAPKPTGIRREYLDQFDQNELIGACRYLSPVLQCEPFKAFLRDI